MENTFDLHLESDDDREEINKHNNNNYRPDEVLELNTANKKNKGFNHEYKEIVDQG